LVDTYLDGAGIYAWKLNRDHTSYEPVPLPPRARARSVVPFGAGVDSLLMP